MHVENESYQPMPEGDEFDIAEDEDFEEVLGALGFPEDETELFDAEYQGRKVPLNKPMRGDVQEIQSVRQGSKFRQRQESELRTRWYKCQKRTAAMRDQEEQSKSKEEFQSTSQLCESRTKDQSKILVM